MSRLTLGQFKAALREPSRRRSDTNTNFPTPMPVANSAVRVFHREGATAARTYLNSTFDNSPYWGPTGAASSKGWANSIRGYFETYLALAALDHRPWLPLTVAGEVPFGANTVGVKIDVVLLDGHGYVARVPLWEKDPLDMPVLETLSGPIVSALGDELGAHRAVGVDFWHLRTTTVTSVSAATARDQTHAVATVIENFIDDED